MDNAEFGRTGLTVSRLTLGCGAVGGLMTKGNAPDQDYAINWARDNGINFFDTAASYGDGASERNLGRALNGNTDGLVISTKVGLTSEDMGDVSAAVERSINASLQRLQLDHVDILQLHNTIGQPDRHGVIDADQVLDAVIPAFEKIRQSGKARFFGFTAKGDPAQLCRLVESGVLDSAQVFYNLLVPSAGETLPSGYPAEDYRRLLEVAKQHGVGSIGVRVLAGGALSGEVARHPLGMPEVTPIGSDTTYTTDVQHGLRFMPLVESGVAGSLPELGIRYAISNPSLPTTEIGIATLDEIKQATAAVNLGPLSQDALDWIRRIQSDLATA